MESWDARGGQVREVARAAGHDGGGCREGGDCGRDWDGEKGWLSAGPGGPASRSTGEAEELEASGIETADPSERERAEPWGEAASDEGGRPFGGSGSRLSRVKGGQKASGAGGGGTTGGSPGGGFAAGGAGGGGGVWCP